MHTDHDPPVYCFNCSGSSSSAHSDSSFGASVATTRLRSAGVRPNREGRLVSCAVWAPEILPARNFAIAQTTISTAQRSASVATAGGTILANSRQSFLCSSVKVLGGHPSLFVTTG